MSNDIDKKIVEIEFENRNFEKGIKQSQKSINELNESLKFKDADKSIKQVQKSLHQTDLHSISDSVKKISDRFSELGVIGTTALMRLTNAAITTGKSIIKSFTVDPLISGLQEYETQMNSVQTILANTSSKGTTLDQVNSALDELNRYADKTIYNFTEMTRNIGTFTAAGVDLNTSVNAIQGIANLAATSGSNAQQASTAMYQLSQALAAGKVSLMDWNSVVNAGMGGEVFQQALRETSKELGTGGEAAIAAKGSFRESLQEGWLTAEVLTETLKKFTTSGAQEWVAEYTGLTQEAVSETLKAAEAQYGEAGAIEEASKQLAEKSGKNQKEIKDILEMAKTAEDAATKVKTFSQLMDTLKEAVQSGWSETWRTVIGDFEEAKELFTGISDALGEVISRSSELRNNMLKVWKSLGGRTKLLEGLANIGNSILDVWSAISQAFYDVFGIVGKELYAITEKFAEFTKELVVNEKTAEDLKRVVRGLASIIHIVVQVISAAAKTVLQVIVYLKPLLSSILHLFAILGDGITIIDYILKRTQLFNRLGLVVARTLLLISEIAKNLLKLASAGGLKIFDLIFYGIRAIVSFYKTIKERFGGIGGFISHEIDVLTERFPTLGKVLSDSSTAFGEFRKKIAKFIASVKQVFSSGDNIFENLRSFGALIKDTFGGVVGFIVDVGKTIGKFISGLFKNFSLEKWGPAIAVISLLSLLVFGIFKLMHGVAGIFSEISESVSDGVRKISKSISNYINAKAMNERSDAILNIAKAIALLSGSLVMLAFVDMDNLKKAAKILGFFAGGLIILSSGINILAGLLEKKGQITEGHTVDFGKSILSMALGMLIVVKAISSMQDEMNKTQAFGNTTFVAAMWGLVGAFSVLVVLSTVMALVTSKWAPDAPNVIKSYVIQLIAVVIALKQLSDPKLDLAKGGLGLLEVAGFLIVFMAIEVIASKFSSGEDSWKNMLSAAISLKIVLGTILDINNIPTETLIRGLIKSLGVIIAFKMIIVAAKEVGGKDSAKTIQATALAFLGLVLAMKIMGKMNADEIKRGTLGITMMMAPMAILMLISNIGRNKVQRAAKTILAMSGAVATMVLCAALMSLLNPDDMWRGTIAISIMAAIMGGIIALTKFVNKTKQGVKTIIVMTVVIGVLSLCAGLLSGLNIEGLIVSFAGIALVFGAMALVFLTLKNIDTKGILAVLAMAVPLAAIGGILFVLGKLDVKTSLDTVIALSVLLVALAVAMKLLSGLNIQGILYGCLGLLAIALTLVLIFEIFGYISTLVGDGSMLVHGAQIFGECIGALVGGLIGGIGLGITATLPAIGTSLTQFMDNIQGFISGSQNLKNLDVLGMLGLVGLLSSMAMVAPLTISLPIMAAGLGALGAGLNEFTAAVEGITLDRLEPISNMLSGVGNLALGLSGFQSQNLSSFGEGLPTLAKNIIDFCDALLSGESSLSVETAQTGADIFAAFAKVAATVPRSGGLIGAVLGDADLGAFVAAMGQAGPAIRAFHDEVTGLSYSNVEQGLKILSETARIASTIPNSGGWIGVAVGENDLDAFTQMMVDAGPDIKEFANGIKGVKYSDAKEGLQILAETIKTAQDIPNSGGSLLSAFVGDNTLSDFAYQMSLAGPDIKTFIDAMPKDSPDDSIDVYADATKAVALLGQLITVASSIDMDSGWEKFWGNNDSLSAFGSDLASFAPSFKTFWNSMAEIDMNGEDMKDKSEAMTMFLDHIAKFTGLSDASLPALSVETGGLTIIGFVDGMSVAADSNSVKTKISTIVDGIFNNFESSVNTDEILQYSGTIMGDILDGFQDAFEVDGPDYVAIGENIVRYISYGFDGEPMDELVSTLSDGIIDGVKKSLGINSPSTKFQEIGKYIIAGLELGLQNGDSDLQTATNRMASTIENQFRDDMGIHSPSVVFEELGGYIVDGLTNGLESGGSMDDIINNALGEIDFTKLFSDYGGDMSGFFEGFFDDVDLSSFSPEGMDDGSFVDQLLAKMQDQLDEQGLTTDIEAVFDADAMQEQLSGLSSEVGISTSGTGRIASATMDSFANTQFDEGNEPESGGKNTFQFVQNNYSPTALDRIAIYRQTRNQFAAMKEAVNKI